MLTVGVDVGGTKVAAGVVDRAGAVLDAVRRETPGRTVAAAVVEQTIVEAVTELTARHDVRAVGIGAAGFVDAARASVVFAPHLSWRNEPLRDAIADRLGLPVVLENDANAALWAEWRFGAARGATHVVCVNLGTGIGGALLVGEALHRGRFGMAGEFGHMQVVPEGRRCECGNRGCWEQYASGNALVREARELAAAGSPVTAALLDRAGGEVSGITGPLLTQAAREGDAAARELFRDIGEWLGAGIANLVAAFDPELVVVGGGLSDAGDVLLTPTRETLARRVTGRGFRPEVRVVAAALGNTAGLVGAADLAAWALSHHADDVRLAEMPIDDPRAVELLAEVQQEYVQRYGGPDETPVDPGEFAAPTGTFLVAFAGEEAIGTAGIRRHADGVAELKRMYVRPQHRRRGHARRLLAAVEDWARRRGYRRIVLETGTAQPEAIALYTSAGYQPAEGYGHYRDSASSRYFGLDL